jgi:NADPH2:quinone reductase
MKTQAVVISEQGAGDVMSVREVEIGPPGPGEVLLQQTAIGLNYMDVYQRSGHYPLTLPSGLGLEAAGRVVEIGEGVTGIQVDDRVAYAGGPPGAYAGHRIFSADRLVPVPDGISDQTAAAVLLKGMTVEYLLNRAYRVKSGENVLFYAASGGVGLLAGQWGGHLGARMIGVTSGEDNCRRILANGYADAIDRTRDDIARKVRELTAGAGVSVVFDSVGKATFDASIESLAPRGYFMSFGATTGEAPPVPPGLLQKKGSLYFCRPTLATYAASRQDLLASAAEVFRLVEENVLKANINQTYQLSDIVAAHRQLESGSTSGSSIILP